MARSAAAAPVVLIDGPSGSGKSTFADAVLAAWPDHSAELVRMDDVYPGWAGLDAASHSLVTELLEPLRSRGTGRWQRWDWAEAAPAEWHVVVAGHPLIVEGCGCLTRASAPLADVRVWLSADDAVRKERALTRDAGGFDAHWDVWQQQWARLVDRERSDRLADLAVETTDRLQPRVPRRSGGAAAAAR
ncbi:AAA family ATPase [Planctomonas sp. JC2975]|nr:AAA family ATPase [Planctomonas sp. JC2975]